MTLEFILSERSQAEDCVLYNPKHMTFGKRKTVGKWEKRMVIENLRMIGVNRWTSADKCTLPRTYIEL